MQNWTDIVPEQSNSQIVGVLLFDAFSNHCLANAIEPLRAANVLAQAELYRWQFLSLDGSAVKSSSGLPVQPEAALRHHSGGDLLFVLPSYDIERHATPACMRALRAAKERFECLVAFDMGSWLLAAAGLLDGRRATLHWDECDRFAERFPEVEVVPDPVVVDGDVLSCGGASTAFDLVLGLIARHHGSLLREDVAALFVPMAPRSVPEISGAPQVRDLAALMRRNIEVPWTIGQFAREMGLGQKALERKCLEHFGVTPRRLYRRMRLREVRRLLQSTSLSIEEIAARGGYRNASAMTRAFRTEFGDTPSAARRPNRSL